MTKQEAKAVKLELKHLVPYLPYGLTCRFNTDEVYTIIGLVNEDVWLKEMTFAADLFECKPILRPMSDLDKEIPEKEGYSYRDLGCFRKHINQFGWIDMYVDNMEYEDALTLLEHHFDVFGLIPAGLAIDINTLPTKGGSDGE